MIDCHSCRVKIKICLRLTPSKSLPSSSQPNMKTRGNIMRENVFWNMVEGAEVDWAGWGWVEPLSRWAGLVFLLHSCSVLNPSQSTRAEPCLSSRQPGTLAYSAWQAAAATAARLVGASEKAYRSSQVPRPGWTRQKLSRIIFYCGFNSFGKVNLIEVFS